MASTADDGRSGAESANGTWQNGAKLFFQPAMGRCSKDVRKTCSPPAPSTNCQARSLASIITLHVTSSNHPLWTSYERAPLRACERGEKWERDAECARNAEWREAAPPHNCHACMPIALFGGCHQPLRVGEESDQDRKSESG